MFEQGTSQRSSLRMEIKKKAPLDKRGFLGYGRFLAYLAEVRERLSLSTATCGGSLADQPSKSIRSRVAIDLNRLRVNAVDMVVNLVQR